MFGIEIIPNLHPMFVHFTVALLSLSVAFHLLDFVTKGAKVHWRTLAQWNLWLGAGFAIVTVLAGIYAYNTVAHDGPSHAAMTLHRNWALPTLLVFLMLAGWSFVNARAGKTATVPFLVVLVIGGGLLLSTAWHGAELVYRHGLGVMSLPVTSGEGSAQGHDHEHAGGHDHDDLEMNMEDMSMDDAHGSASVVEGTMPGTTDAHGTTDEHEHHDLVQSHEH